MRRASALLERLAAPPVRATQERYRHELKYLINEGEHAALACRMAPVFKLDKHARAGGYTIRSLYFDDYCNSAYEEKDAGILMRKKYRVRIYNGSDKVIKLERKKKYGSWIYKEDAPLTRGESLSALSRVLHRVHLQYDAPADHRGLRARAVGDG